MEAKHNALHRALRVLAAAAWACLILFAVLHRKDFTLENVLSYTPKSPLLAAGAMLLLFALKSLTVVFYAGILYGASGVLFSFPAALAVNVCGTLVMAVIPYLLARSVGAQHADELREKHPRLREFERLRSRSSFAFVVALRCVNFINFDVGSMYCGAVRIAPLPYLAASVLGKLTDVIVWSVMGGSLDDPDPAPFLIALVVDLGIAALALLWVRRLGKSAPEKER